MDSNIPMVFQFCGENSGARSSLNVIDLHHASDTMQNGELNVFKKLDAEQLVASIYKSLKPGGRLVLVAHSFGHVREDGDRSPEWRCSSNGLFCSRPHLQLEVHFWDESSQAATTRYFVVDVATCDVQRHAATPQACTDSDYEDLLARAR